MAALLRGGCGQTPGSRRPRLRYAVPKRSCFRLRPVRTAPRRPAENARGGLPLTPTAHSSSSSHGRSRGFLGPSPWRDGLKAQAVGPREGEGRAPCLAGTLTLGRLLQKGDVEGTYFPGQ